jgi:YCII-related domain
VAAKRQTSRCTPTWGAVRRGADPGWRAAGDRRPGPGTHVTASGRNITLTDGPFTESNEVIVSFALIEARSTDEAVELARRFWKIVGDGEGDIRQVSGPGGLMTAGA